jgi:hypothetical protein
MYSSPVLAANMHVPGAPSHPGILRQRLPRFFLRGQLLTRS